MLWISLRSLRIMYLINVFMSMAIGVWRVLSIEWISTVISIYRNPYIQYTRLCRWKDRSESWLILIDWSAAYLWTYWTNAPSVWVAWTSSSTVSRAQIENLSTTDFKFAPKLQVIRRSCPTTWCANRIRIRRSILQYHFRIPFYSIPLMQRFHSTCLGKCPNNCSTNWNPFILQDHCHWHEYALSCYHCISHSGKGQIRFDSDIIGNM